MALNLAYTLHHLQMKFQLQIEIQNCNFNLELKLNFRNWQAYLRSSGSKPSIYITSFANEISIENLNLNFKFQIAI